MSITLNAAADGLSATIQLGAADKVSITNTGIPFMKNVLINGEVTRINQRGVANWAAVANGAYGYDRWKKVDTSNMTQIVEAGNFRPSTLYTLSGVGVTTQQITSPASGNWTLPNIPIAATNVQCEEGPVATPFELRPIGMELSLCQRYYYRMVSDDTASGIGTGYSNSTSTLIAVVPFPVQMRVAPTALEQSGTAGHYAIAYRATTATCTAVPVLGGHTNKQVAAVVLSTSPVLTLGEGGMAVFESVSGYLGWSAEL